MYITYQSTKEGAGAQYQRALALLALAKNYGMKYIHRKLNIGHNYDNDAEWNDKWDDFLNIKSLSYKEPIPTQFEIFVPIVYEHNLQSIINTSNTLFAIENAVYTIDNDVNRYYKSIQDNIRKAYNESNYSRPLPFFQKDKTNIALHIRVFNQCDDAPESLHFESQIGRFKISEDEYIALIDKLKASYHNHNIHIFTQENIYKKYIKLSDIQDIHIHTDTNAIETFHHMVNADVLITARSSFSYLAAIYNVNKILYLDFHHPPLDNWKNVYDYMHESIIE